MKELEGRAALISDPQMCLCSMHAVTDTLPAKTNLRITEDQNTSQIQLIEETSVWGLRSIRKFPFHFAVGVVNSNR